MTCNDSYLEYGQQDAGEADKDIKTPAADSTAYERKELPGWDNVRKRMRQKGNSKRAQAVPTGLKRLLHLLKGGNTKPYYERGRVAHIMSLMPGAHTPPGFVDKAYEPYRDELGKVIGTYAGIGGAGAGLWKLTRPDAEPTTVDKVRQMLGMAKAGSVKPSALKVLTSLRLHTPHAESGHMAVHAARSLAELNSDRKTKSAEDNSVRHGILGMGVGAGVDLAADAVYERAPRFKNRTDLVAKLLALARQETGDKRLRIEANVGRLGTKGLYSYHAPTGRISATGGARGDVGGIAHELGHSTDRIINTRLGHKYVGLANIASRVAPPVAALLAAFAPDLEDSKRIAAMGTGASVPLLGHELYAGLKGSRMISKVNPKASLGMRLGPLKGLPSYMAAAALPAITYGVRKGLDKTGSAGLGRDTLKLMGAMYLRRQGQPK